MDPEIEKKGETDWKRTGDKKGYRGTKREETTGLVELDASDHTKKKTTKDKIQERGKNSSG
eukprot:14951621-Ditylum_brightwellii.AAC.1